MHGQGWNITGNPNGAPWFHQPNGTTLAAQPLDLPYALDVITDNEWVRSEGGRNNYQR